MRVHGDHEVFEQEASLIFWPPFREVEAQATRAWRQGKRDVEQVKVGSSAMLPNQRYTVMEGFSFFQKIFANMSPL